MAMVVEADVVGEKEVVVFLSSDAVSEDSVEVVGDGVSEVREELPQRGE